MVNRLWKPIGAARPESAAARQKQKLNQLGIRWWNHGKLIRMRNTLTNDAARVDAVRVWAANHNVKAEDLIHALEM